MDIASFATQSSKLLDALEKLGTSSGADLKGVGPSGPPDAQDVKEFELALAGGSPDALSGAPPDAPAPIEAQDTLPIKMGEQAEFNAHLDNENALGLNADDISIKQAPASSDVRYENLADELNSLLSSFESGQISAVDLYRSQYITAMISLQTTTGNKISQQASQGVESVLKQQI